MPNNAPTTSESPAAKPSHTMSGRLFRASAISALSRCGGALATLLIGALLARMLSPSDYGTYTIAFTIVLFASSFGAFAVGDAAIRLIGENLGRGDIATARVAGSKSVAIGVGGMLLLAAAYWIAAACGVDLAGGLLSTFDALSVAVWMFAFGSLLLLGCVLRAFGQITVGVLIEAAFHRFALLAVLGAMLLCNVTSLSAVIAAYAIVTAAMCAIAGGCLLPHLRGGKELHVPPAVHRVRLWDVLGLGLPLLATALLFRVMTDGTVYVVDYFNGAEGVAIYGAAFRLWAAISLPQIAVNSVIQPQIAICHAAGERARLEGIMRHASLMAFWPTAICTMVVLLGARPILTLFYGDYYAQGSSVLIVLTISQLLCAIIGSSEHLLSMTGGQRTVFGAAAISASVSSIAAWVLTPALGITGAALAAGASSVLYKLLLAGVGWRGLNVKTWLALPAWTKRATPTVEASA